MFLLVLLVLAFTSRVQGQIPIKEVPIADVIGARPARNRSEPNCFEVLTNGRTYVMIAETEPEFAAWLQAFNVAFNVAGRPNVISEKSDTLNAVGAAVGRDGKPLVVR